MVTAIMPIFFKDFAAKGIPAAVSTAHWGFANSAASFILALLSPLLGTFADYQNLKIRFFTAFLVIGLGFTLLLAVVNEGQWVLCLCLFVFARVGWAGANVFYDAFIVDVTPKERMDRISASGYAWGYIGSVVPFLVIIAMIMAAADESSTSLPVFQTKIGFMIVAVWWLIFSIPIIRNVKQCYFIPRSSSPVSESFKRLWQTFKEIRKYRQAFLFLIAYFFYIDGVGTVISMSTAYGRDLGFSVTLLIAVILFIQIIAFPFALLYGRLAKAFSAKTMLLTGISIYCVITLVAFLLPSITDNFIKTVAFWCIAFLVGSSMGGIQALSRSFYGKLIPAKKSAEFFGFYNVFGKFAAITGPFLMGFVGAYSGHSRWGVLSVLVLFIIGAWMLSRVEDQY
ncbi:MAG: MFS transporter [Desulfobacteraceae bacterium]|nr:MFS transporter [Desulfobacteraceae bacterium]MBC2755251.1 MFS transporter [Desulfobacteraceae bacterium]